MGNDGAKAKVKGRPTKYNQKITVIRDKKEMVVTVSEQLLWLLGNGVSIRYACGRLRLNDQTYRNWRSEHPDFADAADEAVAGVMSGCEEGVLEIAKSGDKDAVRLKAYQFYMMAHDRETYGDKTDITSAGKPINPTAAELDQAGSELGEWRKTQTELLSNMPSAPPT